MHFGLIVTLRQPSGIGQQTHRPPAEVASVLVLTACSVAKADIWEVSKVNVRFVAVLVACCPELLLFGDVRPRDPPREVYKVGEYVFYEVA